MYKITVDSEKCIHCGECVEACKEDVFVIEDEMLKIIHPEDCVGCNDCMVICGFEAILVEEKG